MVTIKLRSPTTQPVIAIASTESFILGRSDQPGPFSAAVSEVTLAEASAMADKVDSGKTERGTFAA